MGIAALPMYDFPELRHATGALWSAIAAHIPGAPAELDRATPLEDIWAAPNLVLAQTCGYPLVTTLSGRVQLVATPCYDAPGCEGPFYRSVVIVRARDPATALADLRGQTCAINSWHSHSGMNALRATIAPLADNGRFFSQVIVTGAHAQSLRAVATGEADIAALDCVSWAHLQTLSPDYAKAVRVIAWTAPAPALPLITSLATPRAGLDTMRQALSAITTMATLAEARRTLRLTGFAQLPLSAYEPLARLHPASYATLQ